MKPSHKRRKFLKNIGISSAIIIGGYSFWRFSNKPKTKDNKGQAKQPNLIIDPKSEKFIYRDGVVLFKEP